MGNFGYPYNDIVMICKDSTDYLTYSDALITQPGELGYHNNNNNNDMIAFANGSAPPES